jgi:hypothetical protein
MDWLSNFWATLSLEQLLLAIGLFVLSLAISFLSIAVVMVKIPENYFSSHYVRDFLPGKPWLVRWSAVIIKNTFGFFLVILGIILSLPGVPGQGILTILLGLIMLDIPGKRPLEAKIIQRPVILSAINNLRARYNKSPLVIN